MNVLLLGGSGFIGQDVTLKLVENGHTVSLLVHKNFSANLEKIRKKLVIFKGNVLDKNSMRNAFKDQDVVVNLVGQKYEDMDLFYDLNVVGALNVLKSCIENEIKKIALISSCLVYGESGKRPSKESDKPNPKTNYSLTKLVTEKLYTYFASRYDLNLSILRLSNVYGPNKRTGVIYNFIDTMKKNSRIIIFNGGKQTRDFIHIDDASVGIAKAVENTQKGIGIFNISTSKKSNLLEILSIIEKNLSKKANIKFVQDKTYNERCVWACNKKARDFFKFSPKTGLEEGIKKTINDVYGDKVVK